MFLFSNLKCIKRDYHTRKKRTNSIFTFNAQRQTIPSSEKFIILCVLAVSLNCVNFQQQFVFSVCRCACAQYTPLLIHISSVQIISFMYVLSFRNQLGWACGTRKRYFRVRTDQTNKQQSHDIHVNVVVVSFLLCVLFSSVENVIRSSGNFHHFGPSGSLLWSVTKSLMIVCSFLRAIFIENKSSSPLCFGCEIYFVCILFLIALVLAKSAGTYQRLNTLIKHIQEIYVYRFHCAAKTPVCLWWIESVIIGYLFRIRTY